ncbi:MAG TPA: hypothetical protein VGU24_03140 [Microvirga sp.]|jgi:hypothetical protein|nr:hypothetical protein [Microvirga sp.]
MSVNERHGAAIKMSAEHALVFRAGFDDRVQRPQHSYAQALAAFDEPTPERGQAQHCPS